MTREATTKLYDLMDEGLISADTVARECLAYMSEAEVADMCQSAGWFDIEDDEDES